MNIAMMVRSYITTPRPKDMIYAPIDLAAAIGEGLAKKGHRVDYYGPIGTEVPGVTVQTCGLRSLVNSQDEFRDLLDDKSKLSHNLLGLWDSYMVNEMYRQASRGKYDVLHFHHPESAMPIAKYFPRVPTVYTLHDPVYDWCKELFEIYASANQIFVAISDNQQKDAPDLKYAATVYNGIKIDNYPYSGEHDDYLLFAGRIIPEKGVREAIQVAVQTGRRLLIIGPVFPESQGYFDQYIKPHLDDQILYLGFIEQEQMWRYYQKAYALLTPVLWEEPFGLTTIEAMACGTPVISFKRGAAQEIIENGKNGFLVESVSEMVGAVGQIEEIDRGDCRESVKEKFSISKMIDSYEKVFERALRKKAKVTQQFIKGPLRTASKRYRLKVPKVTTVSAAKLSGRNNNPLMRSQT